jgi:hypothetical protein
LAILLAGGLVLVALGLVTLRALLAALALLLRVLLAGLLLFLLSALRALIAILIVGHVRFLFGMDFPSRNQPALAMMRSANFPVTERILKSD